MAQVEQQQRILFGVDELPVAAADHHQRGVAAFGHVFANDFIVALATFEVR
ncbi:hypothetical protein D3C80_1979150 [compost metagenome]